MLAIYEEFSSSSLVSKDPLHDLSIYVIDNNVNDEWRFFRFHLYQVGVCDSPHYANDCSTKEGNFGEFSVSVA